MLFGYIQIMNGSSPKQVGKPHIKMWGIMQHVNPSSDYEHNFWAYELPTTNPDGFPDQYDNISFWYSPQFIVGF